MGDSEFSSSCRSSANMARVTLDPSTDLLPKPNFVRVGEVRAASITVHSSSSRDMSTTLYPAEALHSPPACPGLDLGSIGGNQSLQAWWSEIILAIPSAVLRAATSADRSTKLDFSGYSPI